MRVLYCSDLHIEIRERDASARWCEALPLGDGPDLSPFVGAVDLLVLAGDIGRVHSTRNVSPLSYAGQAADFLGCPVVLVPGNHEYYRGSFDEDRAALLMARRPGVTVLDRGEALIASGATRLRVLGATLWTDYAAAGDRKTAMEAAEREIHDHRLVRRHGGARPFLPADALSEHLLSRSWLAGRLREPHDGPTLIVTHHVPHVSARHPRHGLNALASAFLLRLRRSDCRSLCRRRAGMDFRPPPLEPLPGSARLAAALGTAGLSGRRDRLDRTGHSQPIGTYRGRL